MSLLINLGIGLQKDLEIFTSVRVDLACSAGVLLGRVTEHYKLATAMLNRSTPPPFFLLPIIHPLGKTLFLSPVWWPTFAIVKFRKIDIQF